MLIHLLLLENVEMYQNEYDIWVASEQYLKVTRVHIFIFAAVCARWRWTQPRNTNVNTFLSFQEIFLHALKWKYFLVSDLIFWNYISRRKWFALHTRYDMVNNLWLLHFKFSNSSVLYLVHSSRVFLEILLLSHLSIVIFVSLFVYFHFFFFKVSCVVVSIF